jgi:hypothetical protein
VLEDIGLDRRRWRQLVQLAHPDRHGGSAAATDTTAWLNRLRAIIEAQE